MTKKEQKKSIGLTIEEAKKIYETLRVVKRDGRACIVTRDYKMNRLNVEVENNKITSIVGFG